MIALTLGEKLIVSDVSIKLLMSNNEGERLAGAVLENFLENGAADSERLNDLEQMLQSCEYENDSLRAEVEWLEEQLSDRD